jgi:hypothetical protein
MNAPGAAAPLESESIRLGEALFPDNCLAEQYAALIAPLFKLPDRLPLTAWAGHIPFLFVLFGLLRPRKYVELGVFAGASLIAACTAARSFCVSPTLHGIDTWAGDPHAGNFDGEALFSELNGYLSSRFPEAELIRSSFLDARRKFPDGSIDVLNIDGYHTYEAVKEDFVTWFSAVSPQGVILFHDIAVYDRLFGVYRLWAELKEKFETIEFPHAHGLGVLFRDPSDARLAQLLQVFKRPASLHFYQNLVIDIANSLPERVGYYARETGSQTEQGMSRAEPAAGEAAPPRSQQFEDSRLLERLLHSKVLRLLGPASKTWRRAVKERKRKKDA